MRNGTSNRRQRNRNNNGGGNGGNRNNGGNQQRSKVYDSNGPDVRIRGTAHQVTEKYIALAKDATSTGDRVTAESYLQHAEHYQRIISSWGEDASAQNKGQNNQQNHHNKSQDKSQNKTQEKSQEKLQEKSHQKKSNNDDLGLPSSIIGDVPDVKSEKRTAEATS